MKTWENHQIDGINRMPARAHFLTFPKSRVTNAHHIIHSVLTGSRSPAGPRRLVTATRMSASLFRRLSAFSGSTPDQGPKAAKFAVLIPGRAGFPNRAKRSEGSDTTPSETPRVLPCEPLCARLGAGVACTRRSPLKRTLRRLWVTCERARCILLRRWETETLGRGASLPAMPCFGGFRPLFTRSIKAQTGYNLSS